MDHNEGTSRGYYRVELDRGWCDCGKFQVFCMPCSHVIAACSNVLQDPSKHLYVIYNVINVFDVYKNSFPMVEKEEYWPTYQCGIVWHNENLRRKKKGRPNNTRIRTEMHTTDEVVRLYGTCRHP